MWFIFDPQVVFLFSGIAQGVQRSITGLALILGPLWGGALTRRLYLMLGVMAVLEVILAVSRNDLFAFSMRILSVKVLFWWSRTVLLKKCVRRYKAFHKVTAGKLDSCFLQHMP